MSEKDIKRWHEAVTPSSKAPHPWTVKSGGSWDMLDVQPISDEMLAELAQRYYGAGAPWNCRSMPLSPSDREYMYLLYYSMQGLVSRMRKAEAINADMLTALETVLAGGRLTSAEQAMCAAAIAKATGRDVADVVKGA